MKIKINHRYFNKKTCKAYVVVNMAVNTTNKDDGDVMVIYTPIDTLHHVDRIVFVREVSEFKEKFVKNGGECDF